MPSNEESSNENQQENFFYVKDCALAAIATGIRAQTLLELRDRLSSIHPNCIYYHFWGGRLRTSFEHGEYHNDFSHWAHHNLHDDILAEQLELLNPTEYETMEDLRNELIEIMDNRLDEKEMIPWAKSDEQFYFLRSKMIIFQTAHRLTKPEELVTVLPLLSRSSLFYHFIDSARRVPGKIDDFSTWLQEYHDGYQELIAMLRKIDPYLISLSDLQQRLISIVGEYFIKK